MLVVLILGQVFVLNESSTDAQFFEVGPFSTFHSTFKISKLIQEESININQSELNVTCSCFSRKINWKCLEVCNRVGK